jgi:hypothetical protein
VLTDESNFAIVFQLGLDNARGDGAGASAVLRSQQQHPATNNRTVRRGQGQGMLSGSWEMKVGRVSG